MLADGRMISKPCIGVLLPGPSCTQGRARATGTTKKRGAHAAPSGVTTSFRPSRFRNVSGMWTVIVSPSAETAPESGRGPTAPATSQRPSEPVQPRLRVRCGQQSCFIDASRAGMCKYLARTLGDAGAQEA